MTTSGTSIFPRWRRAVWGATFTVLLTAVLNLLAAQRLHEYRNQSRSSELTVDHLISLRGHLLNAETGQRGFLLVGEDPYLGPYRNAVGFVAADLDTLAADAKHGRLDSAEVARLAQLAREKVQELEHTVQLRTAGGAAAAMDVVRSDTGRLLMDSARAIIARLGNEERTRLDERRRVEEHWANVVLLIVLVGTAITIGVLVYLYRALQRYDLEQRAAARELERQMQDLEQFARAQRSAQQAKPTT